MHRQAFHHPVTVAVSRCHGAHLRPLFLFLVLSLLLKYSSDCVLHLTGESPRVRQDHSAELLQSAAVLLQSAAATILQSLALQRKCRSVIASAPLLAAGRWRADSLISLLSFICPRAEFRAGDCSLFCIRPLLNARWRVSYLWRCDHALPSVCIIVNCSRVLQRR